MPQAEVPQAAPDVAAALSATDVPRSLVVRVAGRVYECEVAAVREVVPMTHLTRLPGAPPAVRGIMNLRGSIVTVVDAGILLHSSRIDATHASALIADVGPRGIALLVDRVADVRSLRADEGYLHLDVRELVSRVVNITENE